MQYTQPLASAPPTLVQYRPGIGRWAQQAALCAARARQDPSRTRQSLLTLATFRSWGIHWMTPHEGPSERLPDPVPSCEPAPTDSTRPCLSSRTHRRARGLSWEVRPRALRCVHTGTDATKPASRDRSHRPGLAPEMGGPIYSFLVARGVAAWSAWRIRLVAYGARLESVLGASPRGFESPILRHHPGIRAIPGFCASPLPIRHWNVQWDAPRTATCPPSRYWYRTWWSEPRPAPSPPESPPARGQVVPLPMDATARHLPRLPHAHKNPRPYRPAHRTPARPEPQRL